MGKKYIIEMEDMMFHKTGESGTETFLWRVKGFNSLVFDMTGISKLTPYIEPDLERVKKTAHDDGYSEGYQAGREDLNRVMSTMPDLEQIKRDYDAWYEKGLSDAWEAARKIANMPYDEGEKIFGVTGWHIIEKRTASEVIEKLKAHEQKQKEELGIQKYFKNGEEVIDADGTKAVVLSVSEDNFCQVYTEKGCIENWHIHTYKFHKTGRYFPEIATVLERMRGENND